MYSVVFISSDSQARAQWHRQLSSRGCAVVAVAPGREATAAAGEPIDALVVHLELAADWQHCADLWQSQPAAPVIALSAWTAPDGRYRQRAFRMGCQAFLKAPCAVDQVLEVIGRLASGETHIEAGVEQ